jgi:hypothetical protein
MQSSASAAAKNNPKGAAAKQEKNFVLQQSPFTIYTGSPSMSTPSALK